jgi:hypothetical protein
MNWIGHLMSGLIVFLAGIVGFGGTQPMQTPTLVASTTATTRVAPVSKAAPVSTVSNSTNHWIAAPAASTTAANYGFTQYQGTIFFNSTARTEIDPATFVVWSVSADHTYAIGKDKNCVYFEDNTDCERVDAATFRPLGTGMQYAVDKNYAYALIEEPSSVPIPGQPGKYQSKNILTYIPIQYVDVSSFSLVPAPTSTPYEHSTQEWYAADSHRVYMQGFELMGADSKSFVRLGSAAGLDTGLYPNDFSKDNDNVFCLTRKIEGLDPSQIGTSTNGITISLTKAQFDSCFPPYSGQY